MKIDFFCPPARRYKERAVASLLEGLSGDDDDDDGRSATAAMLVLKASRQCGLDEEREDFR